MNITIRDIARKCNVSAMTVSRVLNNKGGYSNKTQKSVLRAARRFNYDPLKNIPLISSIKSRNIAVVLPNYRVDVDPFYIRALGAVKETIAKQEFSSIFYGQTEFEKLMRERSHKGRGILQCDGIIFICPSRSVEPWYKIINAWQVPAAIVRRTTQSPGIIVVNDDDYLGARLALEHLVELGHERIGYVGVELDTVPGQRTRAFRDFIREKSLPITEQHIFTRDHYFNVSEAPKEFKPWLEGLMHAPSRPTALFVFNDEPAIETIKVLRNMGIRVPEDISIVGFSDNITARMCIPALTTVRIPLEAMTRLACQQVFEHLENNRSEKINIRVKNELVVRESTSPAAPGPR